jgi:ribonuclease VapC
VKKYVLDSFALLAWRNHEAGAVRVQQLIRNPDNRHWLSVINLGEVFYRTARESDMDTARAVLHWVEGLPISLVAANRSLTLEAATLKSRYAISYADSFAAALAVRIDAKVITGDPEFLALQSDGIIELTWLPSTPRRR